MSDKIDAVIASMGWDLDQQEWADMRRLCEAVLAQQPAPLAVPDEGDADNAPWMSADTEPAIAWRDGWNACRSAPPAAEQQDTVIVSRELAERLCHRDNYTRQMARRELRNMLLAGGAE